MLYFLSSAKLDPAHNWDPDSLPPLLRLSVEVGGVEVDSRYVLCGHATWKPIFAGCISYTAQRHDELHPAQMPGCPFVVEMVTGNHCTTVFDTGRGQCNFVLVCGVRTRGHLFDKVFATFSMSHAQFANQTIDSNSCILISWW